MEGRLAEGIVHLDPPAREQFHDARGYGRPAGDGLALAPVEAAHLLFRGDLDAVDGMALPAFLAATESILSFVVYRDLRERGFYVSPARSGWVDDHAGVDLVVHPRGSGPWDGRVAHRFRVLGERATIPAADLPGPDLAVVDEDGEITYLETGTSAPTGTADDAPPTVTGELLGDRVLVTAPPDGLHESAFYGQRLGGRSARSGPIQLSLLEAAYLADQGVLTTPGAAIRDRGMAVEGDRFVRRLAVYAALRDAGLVPKSGYKFGTDFRVYTAFESIEAVGHSAFLLRVVADDHRFTPRDLSLDVRLATSVRKQARFAVVSADDTVEWIAVDRLTP